MIGTIGKKQKSKKGMLVPCLGDGVRLEFPDRPAEKGLRGVFFEPGDQCFHWRAPKGR